MTTKVIETILFILLFLGVFTFQFFLWSGLKYICDGELLWRLSDYVITTLTTAYFVAATYSNYKKIREEKL